MVYETEKIRYISHEIKNQLSVCDLYAEIINKYCEKNEINDPTIKNAVKNIQNALRVAGSSMSELKSTYSMEIKEYELSKLLDEAVELSEVYPQNIGADINLEINVGNTKVKVDKNLFIGVIVNLIKNACEAFEDEPHKFVKISTIVNDKKLKIIVSNNAKPIENSSKIFEEGITSKPTGSGLGLYISKTNIEKMSGSLKLLKSDKVSTDFELEFGII